jgi:hypothetical protein
VAAVTSVRFLNDESSIHSSGTSVQSMATTTTIPTTHRVRRLLSSSGDCGTPRGAAWTGGRSVRAVRPGAVVRCGVAGCGVIDVLIGSAPWCRACGRRHGR